MLAGCFVALELIAEIMSLHAVVRVRAIVTPLVAMAMTSSFFPPGLRRLRRPPRRQPRRPPRRPSCPRPRPRPCHRPRPRQRHRCRESHSEWWMYRSEIMTIAFGGFV